MLTITSTHKVPAGGKCCSGCRRDIPAGVLATVDDDGWLWCQSCVTVMGHAAAVLRAIREDVAAGIVPATVGTFTDLHDYVDANSYLLCVPDRPGGTFDLDTINAVTAAVDEALFAGAAR